MAGKPHAKLNDEQRTFVVRELAAFGTPSEVADALKERYGVEVTRQAIERYDPDKVHGLKKWRELHAALRKDFLENVADTIPEANKAVRVKHLALAARRLKERGNYMAMATMLEGVAKELGNVHSNRREITGKDGGPVTTLDLNAMTIEQIDAELLALLKPPVPAK